MLGKHNSTIDAVNRWRIGQANTPFYNFCSSKTKWKQTSKQDDDIAANLIGANRVIIFDASWNLSYDVSAIFRAFRFGQTKPVYVYRFLAQATMKERIYERQVAKLSLSERVADDLNELYNCISFEENCNTADIPPGVEVPVLRDKIINKREHDSLVEITKKQLSEVERKATWQEYQQNKERVVLPPSAPSVQPSAGHTGNNSVLESQATFIGSCKTVPLLIVGEEPQLRKMISKPLKLMIASNGVAKALVTTSNIQLDACSYWSDISCGRDC